MRLVGPQRNFGPKQWRTRFRRIPASRESLIIPEVDRGLSERFREIQQVFGDTFICAGYLHGLEMHGVQEAACARQLLAENPSIAELICRLERVLNELWLSEFGWDSIEVFAPVYDLLCELMALHGMAFARHGDE